MQLHISTYFEYTNIKWKYVTIAICLAFTVPPGYNRGDRNKDSRSQCSNSVHDRSRWGRKLTTFLFFFSNFFSRHFFFSIVIFVFSAFFIGKKTLMLSPCLSVCLWANFLANHATHGTKIFSVALSTYAGNNPNLVHFWQCVGVKFLKKR